MAPDCGVRECGDAPNGCGGINICGTCDVGAGESCVGGNCESVGELIPLSRKIDWSTVGVQGGIPARTTICFTIDAVTYGNGVTDATTAIQDALDNCPDNQVVYLPTGTYVISAGINIDSYKTLRGEGQESTILLADDMGIVIRIGSQVARDPAVDILSGYAKGSNELVLSDASLIEVDSYVRVDELNDATIPVTNVGTGTCGWCGRESGNRVRGQFVKVTAKNGNTITISPPMYFTFSSENLPQVEFGSVWFRKGVKTEYSGIEDLTIKNNWNPDKVRGTDGKEYSTFKSHTSSSDNEPISGGAWDWTWAKTGEDGSASPLWQSGISYDGDRSTTRTLLQIVGSANCWVKNVKLDTCGTRCIDMFFNNYRIEIRDSHIVNCINRADSNNCYGTFIGAYTSGVLIENNIFESVADGPIFGWSASGNVVAYNYMYDTHRTMNQATWFMAVGGGHHGAHTTFNLWEGNILANLYVDQYWGSHSHNTLFRNRITGAYLKEGIASPTYIQNVHAIITEKNVHYQNYLGNILGTSGYSEIYEFKTDGLCAGTNKLIYRTGYESSGSCSVPSSKTFDTMLRHMNYDYVTNSVKYCDDVGEPGCQGGDGSHTLPDSLYLTSKPSWFGSVSWPPIGPDVSGYTNKIPAQIRFES